MSRYVIIAEHHGEFIGAAEADTVLISTEIQALARAMTEEGRDIDLRVEDLGSQADLAHTLRQELRALRGE